jgi:hypothetical protein
LGVTFKIPAVNPKQLRLNKHKLPRNATDQRNKRQWAVGYTYIIAREQAVVRALRVLTSTTTGASKQEQSEI